MRWARLPGEETPAPTAGSIFIRAFQPLPVSGSRRGSARAGGAEGGCAHPFRPPAPPRGVLPLATAAAA